MGTKANREAERELECNADQPSKDMVSQTPGTLTQHDWNFDAVPTKEIEACCFWEYARESDFILSVRKRCRQAREQKLNRGERDKLAGQDQWKIYGAIGRFANLFQEGFYDLNGTAANGKVVSPFPQPWQSLDKGMHDVLLEAAQSLPIATDGPAFRWSRIGNAPLLEESWRHLNSCPDGSDLNEPTGWDRLEDTYWSSDKRNERPGLKLNGEWTELLLVEIEWERFRNKDIIASFRKWVKAHRPKNTREPSTSRGHKPRDWRASLERLGIMRLMNRHSFEEQLAIVQAGASVRSADRDKYSDKSACRRERKKALADFHKYFPFLADEEKPRSWTPLPGAWRLDGLTFAHNSNR